MHLFFVIYEQYIFFLQISLQMQQLLESSLHSDSWSPVKIKFNWDASYWTKQISSLGKKKNCYGIMIVIDLYSE